MPSNSFGNAEKIRMSIPFRPLTKGIAHQFPSTMISPGVMTDTEGAQMADSGLERRLGFQELTTISGISYFRFIAPYVNSDGKFDIVFIGDDGVFGVYSTEDGTTSYYTATYANPSSISISGTSGTDELTLASGSWYATGLVIGDTLIVDGDSYTIKSFTSATVVVVTTNLTATYSTTTWSGQYRNLGSDETKSVDYVQYLTSFIFTDCVRPPMYFDGTTLQAVDITARYKVQTVAVAQDRLYYGNITWIDNTPVGWVAANPVMVSWAATPGVIGSVDPESYYTHLPYIHGGIIIKLKLMGNLLVAYFNYGIMLGYRTQYAGSTLPYAFSLFETGNRGVYNPLAVASSRDGNYYITTDNIYRLGNNLEFPDPIGTPIADFLLDNASNYQYSMLLNAPKRNFLYAFLRTIGGSNYDTALVYNLTKQSWCKFSLDYEKLSILSYDSGSIYSSLSSTTTYSDLSLTATYADLTLVSYEGFLAATKDNVIYVTAAGLEVDPDDEAIPFYFETGDLDFNQPDTQKTYKRISLRISSALASNLNFTVMASNDQGVTWDSVGQLSIVAGQLEGYCNFLYTGPSTRFRISTSSETKPFIVTEMILDVQGRGLQYESMI